MLALDEVEAWKNYDY